MELVPCGIEGGDKGGDVTTPSFCLLETFGNKEAPEDADPAGVTFGSTSLDCTGFLASSTICF